MIYFCKLKNLNEVPLHTINIAVNSMNIAKNIDIGIYNLEWEKRLAPPLLLETQYNSGSITGRDYLRGYKDYLADGEGSLVLNELLERYKDSGDDMYFVFSGEDRHCDYLIVLEFQLVKLGHDVDYLNW